MFSVFSYPQAVSIIYHLHSSRLGDEFFPGEPPNAIFCRGGFIQDIQMNTFTCGGLLIFFIYKC